MTIRSELPSIEHFAEARIPTAYGDFTAHVYRSTVDGQEHVVYTMGDLVSCNAPLVRVHSECLTGDILASERCDCGYQLQTALAMIAEAGCGALVYLRGHEGRGIGIGHKIRAYALQDDEGLDTVDANTAQGLPVDARDYRVGAEILTDLGVSAIRLLTNNPDKFDGLEKSGLQIVERVSIEIEETPSNARYLATKRTRMGHIFGATSAEVDS
jgi:3,4-dihydroxy 2-butanone 4-phosphate synthase/GTP cyclohydrolase II